MGNFRIEARPDAVNYRMVDRKDGTAELVGTTPAAIESKLRRLVKGTGPKSSERVVLGLFAERTRLQFFSQLASGDFKRITEEQIFKIDRDISSIEFNELPGESDASQIRPQVEHLIQSYRKSGDHTPLVSARHAMELILKETE